MSLLYLDTFSGIAGDMLLGLLVDLGVDLECIQSELAKLPLTGYRIEVRSEQRHAIAGSRVEVHCDGEQPARRWSEIDAMLAASTLDARVKGTARDIFRRLGEAEAHVHRVELDAVHFHEVGALDAIVDIVGSAVGLQLLGVDEIRCSPLPLAIGMTRGGHGAIPLPAPAVVQLLRGKPIVGDDSERELVTPTGAAIAASVARFGPLPAMTIERVGYGVGGWQLEDRPNLLRGLLGSSTEAVDDCLRDRVTVIECHIDDANPEWLGALLDRLMAAGALDASLAPLQMKQNRPASRLTVIAETAAAEPLAQLILTESSAIGVRLYETHRIKLRREPAVVTTRFGEAAVKLAYRGETLLRITPESASCRQLAASSGAPLPEIYRAVNAAANRRYGLED
jgi:uncharacterized protein (TIGR00299 family) protein